MLCYVMHGQYDNPLTTTPLDNRPVLTGFMPCALPHPAAEMFFLLQEPWEVVIPISCVQ